MTPAELFRKFAGRRPGEAPGPTEQITGDERARREEIARKAWPPDAERVSGCCDRADQG